MQDLQILRGPAADHSHRMCLTPTRNESWIVDRFIAAAKNWATHIIVADQCSADETRQKLRRHSEVDLILNDSPVYDERHRQQLLLRRARRIQGKRILLGLDADEALSANSIGSTDWKRIEEASPGTILRFRWANILPGFKTVWMRSEFVPFGFVDDGSEHNGTTIHSPRVPQPRGAPVLDLEDIVVLHFQYVLWDRMASKQRWYQAWEHVKHGRKGALDIFRQYNHMHGSWEHTEIQPMRPEWLQSYESAGIDFRSLECEPVTWWDRDILQMLREHGSEHFRRIAIWDQDWNAVARRAGMSDFDVKDPRSPLDKVTHRLLAATQRHRANWGVRGFERLLRLNGW